MRLAQQLYEGQSTSAKAASASSPTCAPTRCRWRPRRSPRSARSPPSSTARRTCRRSRASTRPSRRTPRRRTRPSARPPRRSRPPTSRARSTRRPVYKLYALIWKRAVACQMSARACSTPSRWTCSPAPDGAQRHLLRANGSTLVKPGYIAVYQEGQRRRQDRRRRDHVLPPMQEGDTRAPRRARRRAAFHRAAAALHRSLAGQGAGGARHRPALDLRHHHLDAAGPRVRGDGQPALHADRHRQDRQPLPHPALPPLRGVRLHRRHGRRARRGVARRGGLDHAAREVLEAVHPAGRARSRSTVTREQVAQARELGRIRPAGKPITVRMGRFGPFVQIGTKDDEEKPRFAGLRPGQKMDAVTLAEALELFKLPRTLGAHRRPASHRRQRRPLRAVREVRRQVRLAEGGRSVHRDARARARGDPRQAGCGCQPHHPGLPGRRHPGAERPLRPRTSPTRRRTPRFPRTATRRPSRSRSAAHARRRTRARRPLRPLGPRQTRRGQDHRWRGGRRRRRAAACGHRRGEEEGRAHGCRGAGRKLRVIVRERAASAKPAAAGKPPRVSAHLAPSRRCTPATSRAPPPRPRHARRPWPRRAPRAPARSRAAPAG